MNDLGSKFLHYSLEVLQIIKKNLYDCIFKVDFFLLGNDTRQLSRHKVEDKT